MTPQGFALATDKLLTAIETQGASSSVSSSSSSGACLGLILLECLDSLAEKGIDSNPANQRVLKDKVSWFSLSLGGRLQEGVIWDDAKSAKIGVAEHC